MLKKLYNCEEKLNYDVPKAKVYFSTFYLGEISKQLSNDIKKIVSQSYPQVNNFQNSQYDRGPVLVQR